jgi:hypothetical protein
MFSIPAPQTEPGAGNTGPARPASWGRAGLLVAITLALLGALVWVLNPPQPRLAPAPLDLLPLGCPKFSREFVPTNMTGISDPPTDTLPEKTRYRVLYRLNTEACSCGCAQSVAACRSNNRDCQTSLRQAKEILTELHTEAPRPKK